MLKIKSIRRGFANNSSSSHSIVLVANDVHERADDYCNEFEYGWDFFTLKSREEKEKYLFTNLIGELRIHIKIETKILSWDMLNRLIVESSIAYLEANRELLPFSNFDDLIEKFRNCESCDMYVDHQSRIAIPTTPEGELNLEFYRDFCIEILNNNYLILGGNDNSTEDHTLAKYDLGVSEIVKMLT